MFVAGGIIYHIIQLYVANSIIPSSPIDGKYPGLALPKYTPFRGSFENLNILVHKNKTLAIDTILRSLFYLVLLFFFILIIVIIHLT